MVDGHDDAEYLSRKEATRVVPAEVSVPCNKLAQDHKPL
jgi:hypothetical protein